MSNGVARKPRPRLLFAALIILLLLLWFNRESTDTMAVTRFDGETMGTSYQVQVAVTLSTADRDSLEGMIADRLHVLDKDIFSTWSEHSEISRFNTASAPATLSVSRDMVTVSRLAQEAYELTDGAFDPTVMPLVNLWGFGPEFRGADIPAADAIAAALEEVDFAAFRFAAEPPQITKLHPLTLDYSAIAKGYAVDEIARLLEDLGYTNYLVDVGGEVLLSGEKAPGVEWRIGLEAPQEGPREIFQAIGNAGQRLAIAASGDYRNYFDYDGQRYSHEIDPTTGWPVTHDLVSVTVLHPSAAMADALATAMMILGEERSMALAAGRELPIYLIMRAESGYRSVHSAAFADYLRDLNNP